MTKPERFTPEQVIEALKTSRGMTYVAARLLRCDPETIRNYARRYASVRATIATERGHTTDTTELALYRAIQNGEGWAIKFYLATQAKDRGYVQRQEMTGADGAPITIREIVVERHRTEEGSDADQDDDPADDPTRV